MKIIITGSNGVLGGYFFSELVSREEFCVKFDRNFFNGRTLTDTSIFNDADIVIHCAANTNKCPELQLICFLFR